MATSAETKIEEALGYRAAIADAADSEAPAAAHTVVLVVFGLDDGGKPHASRFSAADAELAEKAARLMGMHVLRPATDEDRALAAKLPAGRVFGSGKAFVPFVKAATYKALATAAGLSATDVPPRPARAATAASRPAEAVPAPTPAATFADIGVGSLVLALEGAGAAWYKAEVLKLVDDKATLRWPEYPDEPKFSRRLWQLGLLPPERKSA